MKTPKEKVNRLWVKATPKQIKAINKMAKFLEEHISTKFMTLEQADKEIKRMIPLVSGKESDIQSGMPDHITYGGQD